MERVAMEKAAIAANLPKLLEVGVKYQKHAPIGRQIELC
jgi:hypothetical protein